MTRRAIRGHCRLLSQAFPLSTSDAVKPAVPRSHAIASDEDVSRTWQAGDPEVGSALVSQDVWTAISGTIHRYQGRSSFRTWVFAIATNHVREAYRSQDQTRRIQALTQDLQGPPGDDPWTVCSQRQPLNRLAAGLTALPRPLQQVLALYDFERYPAAAIGRRVAIPEDTVRSRVRRALELLSDGLTHPSFARPTRTQTDPIQAWLRSVELELATELLRHAA